jgi:SNF2 family DNA or RNA helicase
MKIETGLLAHQSDAVQKLAKLRVGALFMEMGTGKTLTAMELVRQRSRKISKVIYLTLVNLKHSVALEFIRHSPETSVYLFNDKTKDGRIPKAFVYVVGIESIGQSDRAYLACNSLIDENTCVILDESDTCKNHAALRTMRITAMSDRARYRFALTGTPAGEGIVDLYAQMRFLSAEILGYKSFYSFAANHLEYSEDYPGLITRSLNTDYIAKKINPFVYQVTKDECLNLPSKIYRSHYGSMTWSQQELYGQAKESILMSCPDDDIDSHTIFRLFTALREIVSGFWNETDDPRAKHKKLSQLHVCEHERLALLDDAIAHADDSPKIIIWVNFQYCIGQVVRHLAKEYGEGAIAQYHGQTENREEEIDRWRDNARLLVASPRCGGRGLTLNEASHAIFYNNDFPYRLRAQAEDRCHRIGQTVNAAYHDIVLVGSIDERIAIALAKKESLTKEFKRELDKLKKPSSKRKKLLSL